jgi:hypothetical protein
MAEQSASALHSAGFVFAPPSGGEELQAVAATDTAAIRNAFKTPASPTEGGAPERTVGIGWQGERGSITLDKYPVEDDRALPSGRFATTRGLNSTTGANLRHTATVQVHRFQ